MVAFLDVAVKVFDKQLQTIATHNFDSLASVKHGKTIHISVKFIRTGHQHFLPPQFERQHQSYHTIR